MSSENKISITRLIKGDENTFEYLFKSYYRRLVLFSNRILNDLPASEEIVSDVFTELWAVGHEIHFTSSVKCYLFKMVKNRCLNFLKHQKIESLYVKYLEKNNLFDTVIYAAESDFLEKEMADQIKTAIDTLPEKCREIFLMSRFNHMKYKQIAIKLQISPKTVERHIGIAISKLRLLLKHVTYLAFLF